MNSSTPLVSVVIPYYNRAGIIGKSVASVRSQTFPDWEVIIVDDGSPDSLQDALQPFAGDDRIRHIRHSQNRGPSAARNTGIAAARGRFVALLDSDDQWLPTKLERQLAAVYATPDPDLALCVTQTIVWLSEEVQFIRPLRGPAPGRSLAEFLYNDGGFAQSSSFFLSAALARRVPFRECLTAGEDHMFFIELGSAGARYVMVAEPLSIWYNDSRADRLSPVPDLDAFRAFQALAAEHLPPHVMRACEARLLSGALWRTAPGKSVATLLRARSDGALTTRQIATLFCRNAMSPWIYNRIRSLLDQFRRQQPSVKNRRSSAFR